MHLFIHRDLDGLRHVNPVTKRILETWDTKKLLHRLECLRSLHEQFEDSDWSEEDRHAVRGVIAFKNTEIWVSAWDDVKSILATREHVERGSKEKRRREAHRKKHR